MYKAAYKEERKWSDGYIPAMNQLAAHLMFTNNLISVHFKEPTVWEDTKQGIDQYLQVDTSKMAYRTRAYRYLDYVLSGFTIRTSGAVSELDKIKRGTYADYLLYAVEHPDNPGELAAGLLIDIKQVGWQLNTFPHILEQAKRGSAFVDLNYDVFPYPVVVGTWGVKSKVSDELCTTN
jgi:hypothetical protein